MRSLDAEQQRITEVLFRRLSTRTTSGRDIRLPTRLEEVARVAEVSPEAVLAVVDVFRDPDRSFLTPPWPQEIRPDDILDISHESLIRHWGRLRAWVADEAASADVYRRLDQTARLWSEGLAGLWGSPDLDQALRWRKEARPNKAWAARYEGDFDRAIRFLDASIAEHDRKQAEERKRLNERVEQNRRLAEAERQRAELAEAREREAKAAAGAPEEAQSASLDRGGALASAWPLPREYRPGGESARAIRPSGPRMMQGRARAGRGRRPRRRNKARLRRRKARYWRSRTRCMPRMRRSCARENERRGEARARLRAKALAKIATSRQLAALSVAERDKRFDRSLLLAVEALRTENTSEAREVFTKPFSDDRDSRRSCTSMRAPFGAWPSAQTARPSRPDMRVLNGGGGVVLWDVAARKRLVDEPLAVKRACWRAWPSAQTARPSRPDTASRAFEGGGVVLWDVAARKRLVDEPLPVNEGSVDERGLQPRRQDHRGRILRRSRGARRRGAVGRGRTQTPGRRAALREGGHVHERGLQPRRQDHRGRILWRRRHARRRRGAVGRGRTQTPGRRAALREGGQRLQAWPSAQTARPSRPDTVDLTGGGGVVLWDVAARKRLADEPLPVNEGDVESVAFSPDGKTIAAGYNGVDGGVGGVVLWDVAARKRLVDEPLSVKEGDVESVAFSPDGKTIAAGYVPATAAAAWCCGTWPHANAWSTSHSP